jgi:hypothetical protein
MQTEFPLLAWALRKIYGSHRMIRKIVEKLKLINTATTDCLHKYKQQGMLHYSTTGMEGIPANAVGMYPFGPSIALSKQPIVLQ